MICKHILLTFFNEPKLILLYTVKWFQVLLYITNNLFKHQSFVYTQLNDQTILWKNYKEKKGPCMVKQAYRMNGTSKRENMATLTSQFNDTWS